MTPKPPFADAPHHKALSPSPLAGGPFLRPALAVLAAWLLLTAAGACASGAQPEAAPASAADAVPTAEAPPATEATDPEAASPDNPLAAYGGEVLGEPGEQWLVDEEGRRHFLVEIELRPYYKVGEGYVMLPPGAAYELAEEKEGSVVVKVYDRQAALEAQREAREAAASDGPSALLADLESLEVESVDRLRFRSAASLARRGQWRQDFELVDINRDGHLDIVHGPPRKGDGKPKIFLGDGQGGWRPWHEARFEGPPLDYGDVAVADFDGDGELDLGLAVHLRGLIVLRGDGRGRFEPWGTGLPYWIPGSGTPIPAFSSRTVEAVDWNRDGRPDLLALGEGPRIVRESGSDSPAFSHGERGAVLFLNRGDGRWERHDPGTESDHIFGDDLALGDFDGDGLTDFAIASNVSGATSFVKRGQEDGGWEDISLGKLARPGVYGAVHAVDLDGDGRDELVLGYAVGAADEGAWTGVDVVEYEDGAWRRDALAADREYFGGVTALGSGDLDGDGRIDLVALTRIGERWIFLGDSGGGFVREESPELAPSEVLCQGYSAQVVQLAAAARPLLLMSFAGEPGSEQIFNPTAAKKCPSQGSFEVWEPVPGD